MYPAEEITSRAGVQYNKDIRVCVWHLLEVTLEDAMTGTIGFSGLIAVMAMGMPRNMILTVAVISILITASLVAFLIDLSYPQFLERGK